MNTKNPALPVTPIPNNSYFYVVQHKKPSIHALLCGKKIVILQSLLG